ncbi:MAG: hypothetical protein HY557_01520 [Euryarchaeota archaeon]|nr:hypothetical protein [Euryarchaeota archaeon]
MTVSARCVLTFDYPDEATAEAVRRALAPDDAGFVRSRTEGARLVADIEATSPMRLLHTVEDYLACLGVAERAVAAAKGRSLL